MLSKPFSETWRSAIRQAGEADLLQGHLSPELHNHHTVCKEAVPCLNLPQVVKQHRICSLQNIRQGC